MLYEFKQTGLYGYLDHNLIEAVMLGASAHTNVDGGQRPDGADKFSTSDKLGPG